MTAAQAAGADALLRVENVSMSFGGVHAVQDVSLSIGAGERVAVIGPNGAGKSTLVNCIAGDLTPTAGDVVLSGRSIRRLSAARRSRRGVSRTFQHLELFLSMTVLENVRVAIDGRAGHLRVASPRASRDAHARAMHALKLFRVEGYADVPAGALPYGVRKLVELSRAFVTEPALLLLDEPVAGLTDTDEFLDVLAEGLEGLGCGVLLVEHDMATVQRICQTVHVLDSGTLIASGTYAEVAAHPRVIEAYLGAGHGSAGGPGDDGGDEPAAAHRA